MSLQPSFKKWKEMAEKFDTRKKEEKNIVRGVRAGRREKVFCGGVVTLCAAH